MNIDENIEKGVKKMSVPNQKMIYIQRISDSVRKDFLKVSNKNLQEAMYNLKSNAFKLWIYFVDNSNGYLKKMYPVDFWTIADVSESTYRRSFDELLEKGYLIQHKTKKNFYMFREVSDYENIKKLDEVNSVDSDEFEILKKDFI